MGIDYSFSLDIGYKISGEDLPDSMFRITEQKSHMEDRFDPRSGKKIAPVRVIDEEGGEETYILDGKEHEDTCELAEALAEKFGCDVDCERGYGGDDFSMSFTLRLERTGEDDNGWGNVAVGSSILFDVATSAKARAAMKKLGKDLKKLGIDPGPAKIMIGSSVG